MKRKTFKVIRCVECGRLIDIDTRRQVIPSVDATIEDIDIIGLADYNCPFCHGNDQINERGEDIRNGMTWRF